jgi:hypothetical protein
VSAARRFIDAYGFSWQVWELSAAEGRSDQTVGRRSEGRGWLYFFSRGTTLVLRDYVREWASLSWEELDALRLQAQVLGSDTTVRVPDSAPRFDRSLERQL